MADKKTKRGPADRARININETYELTYWAEHLGVTQAQLVAAVGQVGFMVRAVKEHLGK
jgi:hypothetical protein